MDTSIAARRNEFAQTSPARQISCLERARTRWLKRLTYFLPTVSRSQSRYPWPPIWFCVVTHYWISSPAYYWTAGLRKLRSAVVHVGIILKC